MLKKVVFLLCAAAAVAQELCRPDTPDGYKVRLSIKTALGDEAYKWTDNEQFLFQAVLAFAMRNQDNQPYDVSNILVCEKTDRVSFWFVVTSVNNPTTLIDKEIVEAAIRKSRGRINSAFLLTDQTLEFLGIPPTLASPVVPATAPWLIVFGVVMGLVGAGIVFFVISGVVQRKRKKSKKASDEDEETRVTSDNSIPCENMDGIYNRSFSDNEKFTQM